MVDFHTHILPGIDDGSRDIGESIRMLEEESEQGVQMVLATPHFYAHRDTVSDFLRRREESWMCLQKEMQDKGISLPIIKGAEVYYFPDMGKAKQLSRLCMEEKSILLLELPFVQWTESILSDVRNLIEKQKFTVLLAHVERYYSFQKNKKIWKQMFQLPLYAQFNAGGFEKRKKRKIMESLFSSDIPFVLGSDCHNMQQRLPNLQQGREYLYDLYGDQLLAKIEEAEERLLGRHE